MIGKQFLTRAALLFGLAAVSGCAMLPTDNPLIPPAKFVVNANPTRVVVTYTLKLDDGTITVEARDTKIRIASRPNDGTPGMTVTRFSTEYVDMAGKAIPPLFLAKSDQPFSAYMPPASANKPSSTELELPIYNQQVRMYGQDNAYNFEGSPSLNRNFSHTINCRVTLYGEDDNYNQVQIPFTVPIQFEANITR